jgi:hypothetical protein
MADSIPAALAEQLASGKLEEIGLKADQLRKVLAMGGRRKEFVIKNEIEETLDNVVQQKSKNIFQKTQKGAIRKWKIWQLVSPRRFAKYNIRNLTGDADAMFAGNPRAFKKVPQAVQELYDVFAGDKAMTPDLKDWFERGGMQSTLQAQEPDLKDWFERGGMQSTLQAQEMGELNKLKMFSQLQQKKGKFTEIPTAAWQKYWKGARLSTDFRESVLRYSAYLDYLEQMKASKNGLPKDYGASIPEEIQGLHDIESRAFFLSNDLLGAYDRVGVAGQALREHLFPFWSWKEVNFRRYVQMFKNAANEGKTAQMLGRKVLGGTARTPFAAYRVGKFLIKATAFWTALQVWNHTRFPEEEDQLPESVRSRPHIILGRDENGEILYFSRIGALGDLLEWFGLDTAPQYIDQWMKGKRSLKEIALDMAKQPVNIIVQGGVPFLKLAGETITRRALFPDVFKPGTVRDRGYHIARSFGLENEYRAIAGKPSRPYRKSIFNFFGYRVDPDQAAYGDIYTEKNHFLKKIGKYGEGFWLTPAGNALYNARSALRYQDTKAAMKYMGEYLQMKVDQGVPVKEALKGLDRSMDNMDPLAGLTKPEALAFVAYLKKTGELPRLLRAIKYYAELRNPPIKIRDRKPGRSK